MNWVEYFRPFNDVDVIRAALVLATVALPIVVAVWALVRHQRREMAMHFCPWCARPRGFNAGRACPHCGARMTHAPWP